MPITRDTARTIYLGEAAIAGAIVAWPIGADPVLLLAGAVALGILGALIRNRLLHERQWSRIEIVWIVVFFAVFVGVRVILRRI